MCWVNECVYESLTIFRWIQEAHFSIFCCYSVVSNSLRPYRLQHPRLPCPSLSPCVCWLMSVESAILCNHLTLCCLLCLLPSIVPSIRVFSNESALCIGRPQYRSFSYTSLPKWHLLKNQWHAGTSPVVQWLRICLAVQGMRVRSLVGKLRSHMPQGNHWAHTPSLGRS